ncbi:MAG: nicotinate (nicotinamide) nucleotide adenylyltransferase [Bdellovibrionaceae bacterium]|nr:nicotinate (nicotinamide) nucleotide adenylyltransferase [Pseudobdellovibrionaceae bacterium]
MKIGLFGGTFNPPHLGHLNGIETVRRKMGLDKIFIIPNFQNPLKKELDGPTPEHRLNMLRAAIVGYEKYYEIDTQELERKGLSYTKDTIAEYRKQYQSKEIFLILGGDNLENFDKWKDYKKILEEANVVVTTRPGYDIPTEKSELPKYLEDLTADIEFNFIELTTGRSIQFVTLDDIEISSTELRKKLRTGRPVTKFLPLSVENYIKENNLYRDFGQKVKDYKKFALYCMNILEDKKGIMTLGYDLTEMSAPAEYTVIASGTSTRHAVSLAESLTSAVKDEFNLLPQSIEGTDEGRWVVIDYGSLIIHIFYDYVRQEYNLERLWKEATPITK